MPFLHPFQPPHKGLDPAPRAQAVRAIRIPPCSHKKTASESRRKVRTVAPNNGTQYRQL
jgi:hypothetical protein